MLGGMDVSSRLSNIYTSTQKAMADSLSRLASGKRIQNPGDDFAGYMRASDLKNDIAAFDIVKQDLQEAKGVVDYAISTGSSILEDLSKMKDLAAKYAATSDEDQQALITAEFDALVSATTDFATAANWNGTQVYDSSGSVTYDTIDLDPNTSANADLTVSFSAGADLSSLDATDSSAIQTQIETATSFLAQAQALGDNIDRHANLTNITINSKEATASAITDIDDAKELANRTDLQVRQQAAISMLSQANVSRMGIMQLYM